MNRLHIWWAPLSGSEGWDPQFEYLIYSRCIRLVPSNYPTTAQTRPATDENYKHRQVNELPSQPGQGQRPPPLWHYCTTILYMLKWRNFIIPLHLPLPSSLRAYQLGVQGIPEKGDSWRLQCSGGDETWNANHAVLILISLGTENPFHHIIQHGVPSPVLALVFSRGEQIKFILVL